MAIRRNPKKRNAGPRQKQSHRRPAIDPMVNPGNSAHRHQARAKTDQARPHHRMVALAQSSPGDRSARAHQRKTATVMLGQMPKSSIRGPRSDVPGPKRALFNGDSEAPRQRRNLVQLVGIAFRYALSRIAPANRPIAVLFLSKSATIRRGAGSLFPDQ